MIGGVGNNRQRNRNINDTVPAIMKTGAYLRVDYSYWLFV